MYCPFGEARTKRTHAHKHKNTWKKHQSLARNGNWFTVINTTQIGPHNRQNQP